VTLGKKKRRGGFQPASRYLVREKKRREEKERDIIFVPRGRGKEKGDDSSKHCRMLTTKPGLNHFNTDGRGGHRTRPKLKKGKREEEILLN